ncbi:hypothetical protein TTHERM_000156769 (macronuclear) [Tetrahymena thermophila SB210]|uniref:Uncharacterized protein n=1 Tax=Tetrahymena thermophila (strain SB210) TaxID=312017 RepID=W7XJV7_TETTS|nr:hypothetical protein TTHERM_000156769 [Tetrahymena thermophila SB210]EWS75986.1 hypothetical protein TTHERM_000156769 [Tetrahymena thermophila SB210]|eukprot:XP_012651504.1 hypothetical protein TTHERM_000156769 [Tetrahymena thermophila SB210]
MTRSNPTIPISIKLSMQYAQVTLQRVPQSLELVTQSPMKQTNKPVQTNELKYVDKQYINNNIHQRQLSSLSLSTNIQLKYKRKSKPEETKQSILAVRAHFLRLSFQQQSLLSSLFQAIKNRIPNVKFTDSNIINVKNMQIALQKA